MRKAFLLGIAAVSLAAASPAAGQGEDHNCAGTVVSSVAGPGFGAGVAAAARVQVVDNFGLANCGNTEGENP